MIKRMKRYKWREERRIKRVEREICRSKKSIEKKQKKGMIVWNYYLSLMFANKIF
jgi:hypothetical protein